MNTPVKKSCFMYSVTLACSLAVVIPTIGSSQDAEPNVPDRTNYDLHCALCHGEGGSAVESLEKLVKLEIPHLGSSYVQEQSDEQIRKVILEGKGKMIPVQTIAEDEIPGVIVFLRTFEEP